jgi:ferrous iron transport protein B
MVAVDLLFGRRDDVAPVDAVLCIVDASNLQRNLYLVSQVLELGLPTVLAVNMLDVAEDHGIRIDLKRLEQRLGIPIVAVQANRRRGLARLKTALAALLVAPRTAKGDIPGAAGVSPAGDLQAKRPHRDKTPLPEAFEAEVNLLEAELAATTSTEGVRPLPRCLVRRLLLDVNGYLQRTLLQDAEEYWTPRLEAARAHLASAGCPVPEVETFARYDWAHDLLEGVLTEPRRYKVTASDRIDRVLTHRVWGMLAFAVVMLIVFQAVFVGARPAMQAIQAITAAAGGWIEAQMAEGALRSLLVDGLLGGVGAVLAFLPQILILFAFLAVLEDCGYMARSAYLMDRVMLCVGLSGKSFIPLLSSFACAVPGIMATRVIENERDRLTTILVAPLLTCSARLPIYALLIAALIPSRSYLGGLLNLQGLTLASLYLLGIVAAVICAMVFKRTILRGQTPPFVMELPSYKWPSPRTVLFRMAERGWVFVRCAGTLILAVSILVWAALYYPHDPHATHQQQQRDSFLGQAGRVIEPAVRPLGWDWRIGCAVIASLPAREIVVATMGVMYHLDDETESRSLANAPWAEKLRSITWDGTDRPVFNVPVALSIMVFFALCAQCAATLAVIRRETNSWRWPAFTFAYMTVLAYFGAMATYQFGTWISG